MPDDMNNDPIGRPSPEMHRAPAGKSSVMPWAILLVVILAVLIGAVMFRDRIMPKNAPANKEGEVVETPSGYQAVFLSNGQVYFGQLSGINEQYMTLKDIYYIVLLPDNLQGADQQANGQAQTQQPTLRKLGKSGEIHGPVDLMKINREQVLYYQEITEEGAVMKAIRTYQKDPVKATAPANSNTPAPAANTPAPANNAPANNAPNQ